MRTYFLYPLRMKMEKVKARIKLDGIEVDAVFDTGAPVSVVPKELAMRLEGYRELKKKYYVGTAKKGVGFRIIGKVDAYPEVGGCSEIPATTFEVSDEVDHVIIGRPELDKWDIVFTPEGPRPRKCPVELEVI